MKNYTEFEADIIRSFIEFNGLTAESVLEIMERAPKFDKKQMASLIADCANSQMRSRLPTAEPQETKEETEWEEFEPNTVEVEEGDEVQLLSNGPWLPQDGSMLGEKTHSLRIRRRKRPAEPKDDNFLYFAPGETVIQEGDEMTQPYKEMWVRPAPSVVGKVNGLKLRRPKPAQQAVEKSQARDDFYFRRCQELAESNLELTVQLDAVQKRVVELEKDFERVNNERQDAIQRQVEAIEELTQLRSTLEDRETDLRLESNKVERMRGEVDKLTKELSEREKELAEKAYKGPWRLSPPHPEDAPVFSVCEEDESQNGSIADCYNFSDDQDEHNARFIADSRTTMPIALEALRLALDALNRINTEGGKSSTALYVSCPIIAQNALQKIQTLITNEHDK